MTWENEKIHRRDAYINKYIYYFLYAHKHSDASLNFNLSRHKCNINSEESWKKTYFFQIWVCAPHVAGWIVKAVSLRSLCLLPSSHQPLHPDEEAPVDLITLCFVCLATPRPTHYIISNHKPLCNLCKLLQSMYLNEWINSFILVTYILLMGRSSGQSTRRGSVAVYDCGLMARLGPRG